MAQYPAPGTSLVPSKLVTKANTAGATVLFANQNLTPGDAIYGSWVQLSASLAADSLIVGASVVSGSDTATSLTGPIFFDIGCGSSGAETVLGTLVVDGTVPRYIGTNITVHALGGFKECRPWLRIAAGQRVAMRAKAGGNSGATAFTVNVFSVPYANLEGN